MALNLHPSESLIAEIAAEWSIENARKVIANLESGLKGHKELDDLLQAEDTLGNNNKLERPRVEGESEWQSNIFDPNSLLHIGHISKSSGEIGIWQSSLSPAEIDIATERYNAWLRDAGYII